MKKFKNCKDYREFEIELQRRFEERRGNVDIAFALSNPTYYSMYIMKLDSAFLVDLAHELQYLTDEQIIQMYKDTYRFVEWEEAKKLIMHSVRPQYPLCKIIDMLERLERKGIDVSTLTSEFELTGLYDMEFSDLEIVAALRDSIKRRYKELIDFGIKTVTTDSYAKLFNEFINDEENMRDMKYNKLRLIPEMNAFIDIYNVYDCKDESLLDYTKALVNNREALEQKINLIKNEKLY